MPRLTLDITRSQQQQLKTLASYAGISMRDFILARVVTDAAKNVFLPRQPANSSEKELLKLQKSFFKKSEVIVLSENSWKEFKNHLAENKKAASKP